MSAVDSTTPASTPASTPTAALEAALTKRAWKVPIVLGVVAVLGILMLGFGVRAGKAVLEFTDTGNKNAVALPLLTLDGRSAELTLMIVGILLALGSVALAWFRRRTPLLYIILFALVLISGFLVWGDADTGNALPVTSLLVGALALGAPLIFGGLGGVLSERVGVTNVAIEGQLLFGAFLSAIAASITGNVFVGLLGGAVAGMLVSFVLGAFSIKYAVNQVIVGIVLDVLVLGLTTFLYEQVLVNNQNTLNNPPQLNVIRIPLLSQIPVIGPFLFSQTILVYILYVVLIAVSIGLYRTRWGLRLRSVGEHPQAADTVGINVGRTRFWNVALAGAIVGLGGAYWTVGSVGGFSQNMTNGAGYIALAAVIVGGWDPIRVTLAALLFGFAQNLGYVMGIIGAPVPNDVLLMLPYIVTIFAVAGIIGRVRGPAAAGRPYVKG
jgi:ABC-type uncharacterized transport system permease subunit